MLYYSKQRGIKMNKKKQKPLNLLEITVNVSKSIGSFIHWLIWDDRYDMMRLIPFLLSMVGGIVLLVIFVLIVISPYMSTKLEQYENYYNECMATERYTDEHCDKMALHFVDGN